jgi:hypothetical protein
MKIAAFGLVPSFSRAHLTTLDTPGADIRRRSVAGYALDHEGEATKTAVLMAPPKFREETSKKAGLSAHQN